MNPIPENPRSEPANTAEDLPRPIIRKMRWPFPVIWLVPLLAAGLTAYFLYQHHRENGLEITIEFPDAMGIVTDQTLVQVHGVPVGRVKSVVLSDDHAHATVHVRLNTQSRFLATDHTRFWLVRPEFSLENISGLNSLVGGPYIEALPGEGSPSTKFAGLLEQPKALGAGINIVLHADRLGSVTPESAVTYLGIQVGVVQEVRLGDNGNTADVTLFIWQRYAPLVRVNSVFWMVKAADIKGGLFSGVKVKLDSLRSLITGGVSFATPEKNTGAPASDGAEFMLHDQPNDDWMKWRPKIALSSTSALSEKTSPGPEQQRSLLSESKKK